MASKSQKTLNNAAIINTILSGKAKTYNGDDKARIQHIKDNLAGSDRASNDKIIIDAIENSHLQPYKNDNAARVQHIKDSLVSNNRVDAKNVPFNKSNSLFIVFLQMREICL